MTPDAAAAPSPTLPETSETPTPAQQVLSPDAQLIDHLHGDIAKLNALLQERLAQRDAMHAQEEERAKTPLALHMTLMGCEYATIHFPDPTSAKTIPDYEFQTHPCIVGKTRPDQDCRTCIHHQVLVFGRQTPAHDKRYERYGMVIPIADDKQADKVAAMIEALDMAPLRRPDHEIDAIQRAITTATQQQTEAQQRERIQAQAGSRR